MCHALLQDPVFFQFLKRIDEEFAAKTRSGRCQRCGSALHSDDYPRKPRGMPAAVVEDYSKRLSFTCGQCDKRATPDVDIGGKIPTHSHPNYVVYTLKPFKARITLPDGTQRISKHAAGEAYWSPALTHSVENLGSTDVHNLIVELKPGGKCQ